LPAERGEEVAIAPSQPPPPRAHNPAKVVIIEDNQDSAEVLALSLQTQGYSTAVAHSGPAGLLLVEQTRPDVVLCDLGLPGMDGIEVCRRVRKLAPEVQPVMVALTGWGMQKDRERTQATGFDHHLVKPVAPAALFELLDSLAIDEEPSTTP
jgi:CheY-like chemotaxis protein